MDDVELLARVRELKLAQPLATAKECHKALLEAGEAVEFSAVKKACSKATKSLADAAPAPAPEQQQPALVNAPPGSVAFLRCQTCERRLTKARVCASCLCVSYCNVGCRAADKEHTPAECKRYARHLKRDVSVSLPRNPAWLHAAMEHRADMEMCELLKELGIHDDTYGLLCGCVLPSSPHRYVPEPAGLPTAPIEDGEGRSEPPRSWADYYSLRRLPPTSPLALLLSWPMTVLHALSLVGLATETSRPLTVHYLGPEKEVMFLHVFRELAFLMPSSTVDIVMVGPLSIPLPDRIAFQGAGGGSVSVSVQKGLYHDCGLGVPDVAVAPNAGLAVAGYSDRWPETVRHIQQRAIPFIFTDYSEQSIEKGLRLAADRFGMQPSIGLSLNPFRGPLRLPLVRGGAVGFPTLSNGFLAGFNTTGAPPKELRLVDVE